MVLDSQALEHLQIIQAGSGVLEGSLFHYIDHCRTSFGRRMLKRWLISPLANVEKIIDRQDAIEDLIKT
jgi:DNA mismatch repair ATPase MutS